jgi:hypothetical protein
MSKNYVRDRKVLGLVEVINMLDDKQKATQRDVDEISHAFQWIGMDVKLPHLNLKDEELKATIIKVKIKQFKFFYMLLICVEVRISKYFP